MDESKAREILGDAVCVDGRLGGLNPYIWTDCRDGRVCLDAKFTVDQLEAVVWWMRNQPIPEHDPDEVELL